MYNYIEVVKIYMLSVLLLLQHFNIAIVHTNTPSNVPYFMYIKGSSIRKNIFYS